MRRTQNEGEWGGGERVGNGMKERRVGTLPAVVKMERSPAGHHPDCACTIKSDCNRQNKFEIGAQGVPLCQFDG